jgi:hypothetical protein
MNISTCDKRIPNIFAYSETRIKVLPNVPSKGEEQVSTVAKPELEVAVIISGIFRYINSILYARNTGKNTQNTIDNGKIRVDTRMLMYTLFYSN